MKDIERQLTFLEFTSDYLFVYFHLQIRIKSLFLCFHEIFKSLKIN